MYLSDFATLVQLGIGLHLGAAILQLLPELSVTPLASRVDRLRALAKELSETDHHVEDLADELDDIAETIERKRSAQFKEYKYVLKINALFALAQIILLIYISWNGKTPVTFYGALSISALSVVPAPLSWLFLWYGWHWQTRPERERLDQITEELFP